MVKKIIAVFKTHFDFGYTDTSQNVLNYYCTDILDKALYTCESSQRYGKALMYKLTLPAFLLLKMYENSGPDRKKRMSQLIRNDQLVCHALPFTIHTPLLNRKLTDAMFMYADEYSKIFSKKFPISAKLTDVPGHTSSIIKPLLKKGVRFLHLGKNPASPKPDVPLLFWWEDLEGNRILTMYSNDYGSSVLPPEDWKYPVWLAMLHTGDNVGVQDVEFILQSKKKVPEEIEFSTGTLDDFAHEILSCDLSELPVVRGEISDTWIHGIGSYPNEISIFRKCLRKFDEIEHDLSEKDHKEFLVNALNFCEHTFGINILKYFGYERYYEKSVFERIKKKDPNYILAEQSWDEQRRYVLRMQDICNRYQIRKDNCDCGNAGELLDFDIKKSDKGVDLYLPNCQKITLSYEYTIFGADDIHGFMKKYLVRYFDWSISDFGKWNYPEISKKTYYAQVMSIIKKDKTYEVVLTTVNESSSQYGNYSTLKLKIYFNHTGLHIQLETSEKQATPMAEAGNFCIDLNKIGQDFIVTQADTEINVGKDIVNHANHLIWAIGDYAKIDSVKLFSYDAPLISFEKNAIFEFCNKNVKRKRAKFVVNLFNNQWGTNFPQWIEGSMKYSFRLQMIQ